MDETAAAAQDKADGEHAVVDLTAVSHALLASDFEASRS